MLGMLAAIAVQAQNEGPFNYSLQQCIDYAYEHQTNILNARLDEQMAHAKVRELYGVGLPQISGSLDVNHFIEKPTALVTAENFGGPAGELIPFQFNLTNNGTAGISATQLLFDGSYLLGLKAAKTFEDLSRKQTKQTKIDIAANVSKAYYAVLVGNSRLGSLSANIDRLQKSYDEAAATLKQGFIEKIDLQRLEVSLNNLKAEKINAERITEMAIYLLKFQMGMPQNATLTTADNIENLKLPEISNLTEYPDFNGRNELDILKTQRQLQAYNVKRFKMGYYPTLAAYGNLGTSTNSEEFDLFESDKRWYWNAQVGARLTMPIFTSGVRHNQIKQEELALRKIDNSTITLQEGFQLEYNTAKRNFINALASYDIQKKNRELANEIVRVSKIKYSQGVGSNLEVIDAESQQRAAESIFYTTVYDALIAKVELDKALGLIK